ncbi:MAG: arsenate reductase ArsC [Candidatus Micrarchaeota archaeon]|nr:arsenate reductase ArsC [Candidatus Micrarchaeota archaeon]
MKKVLFVCIENACRSQMAEAFFNKYSKGARAYSAGSKPAAEIDPQTVEVMEEKGIGLRGKKPKGFNSIPTTRFDLVITMGCKDECPFVAANKRISWQIDDPKGKPIEKYRKIRDEIEERIKKLLEGKF